MTMSQLLQLPDADAWASVRDYLIAATAKDCSLMLCMQRQTPACSATTNISEMPPEDMPHAGPGRARDPDHNEPQSREVYVGENLLHGNAKQAPAGRLTDARAPWTPSNADAAHPDATNAHAHAASSTINALNCDMDNHSPSNIQMDPKGTHPEHSLQARGMSVSSTAAEGEAARDHLGAQNPAELPMSIHGHVQCVNGSMFGYALVVVDLDRKAATKIPKHHALDVEIMQHALN